MKASGKRISYAQKGDRSKDSLLESKRKKGCGYDMVVAAPKSVTIAALVAKDHRVIQAHRLAAATLTLEIELRAKSAGWSKDSE